MDDEIPSSDELEAIGFQFNDSDSMYQHVAANIQVIVTLHDNTRKDNYMMAKSLSLYWLISDYPKRVSGSYSIRDNPTLGQIKALLTALKGE